MQFDKQKIELVIDGQFNPAIHTPVWYKTSKLLDGVSDINAISTPNSSRLKFGDVEINCSFNSWTASTEIRENYDSIVQLANKLFFDLLPHTPITGGKTIISHRYVDSDGLIAEKARDKINTLAIAPRFSDGVMQWSRNSENEVVRGSSMFWLCGDDTHFHTSHEYEFGIESRFTGSDGYRNIGELLDIAEQVVNDSAELSQQIISALELSNE